MPNGPDFAAATQALSPDELQELHTAVYQVRTGKMPGNFNTDKVNLAWGALNSQVGVGAGKPLDKEDIFSGIKQPEPFSKEAFKSLAPGLLGPAGILGKQAIDAVQAGLKDGPMAGLGAAAGVDKARVEQEASLGHTGTVAVMTALPAILALAGGRMAHGFQGGLEAAAPRPAPVAGAIAEAPPTLRTSTPDIMHPVETAASQEAVKAQPVTPQLTPRDVVPNTPVAKDLPRAAPAERAPEAQAPVERSVSQIAAGISEDYRPAKLDDGELQKVASLGQADYKAAGLKRDDWLAARSEARRRFGGEAGTPTTPQSDIHDSLTRVLKAAGDKDLDRRTGEFVQSLKAADALPDDVKGQLATSLEQRGRVADLQHAEISRVMAAQDFAAGLRDSFSNRMVRAGVGADDVGFDPVSGTYKVSPEIDSETGDVRQQGAARTQSALSPEERQYAGLILGEKPGRSYTLREPDGSPIKLPKLDDAGRAELAQFTKDVSQKLDTHLSEVKAQGGVPTDEQKQYGMGLISALQEATGKRLAFKGKLPFEVDEQGVVTHPGIDPAQSWWNKVMGKPATSHFAKPDSEAVARRLGQLQDESAIAKQSAGVIRKGAQQPGSQTATIPAGQTAQLMAATAPEKALPEVAQVPIKRYDEFGNLKSEGTVEAPKALPAAAPSRESQLADLTSMRQRLGALEGEGKYASTQAKLRKSIAAYEKNLGVPSETSAGTLLRSAADAQAEEARAQRQSVSGAPVSHEGKSDALYQLLAQSEEVPGKLTAAMSKLHDLTPLDDRDYIAHSVIANETRLSNFEMAKRYAGGLQILREGLKAGQGELALQKALSYAGSAPKVVSKGEAGFVTVPKFVPDIVNELARYAVNGAVGAKDVVHAMGRFLEDGTYSGVSKESRNAMFKFRGEMTRVQDVGAIAFHDATQAVRSLPPAQRISLMADAQRGKPMPTADLQDARNLIQQQQDASWVDVHALRPNVGWLRDHIGTIWKKAPNNASQLFEKHAQITNTALLQGDKGMLRRRIFETVEEGIKAGGVPATDNLFEMHLLDLGRQQQFVHVNRDLFPALKAQGRMIQGADKAAQLKQLGFMPKPVPVDAHIAATWFPVDTAAGGTVMAKGEPWYMNQGEHEMLKKYLGPDFVRNNVIGKAVMNLKNIYTPVELFGPFHAASMVFKSTALGVSQGMNRAFNSGVLGGDVLETVRGLGEAIDGLRSSYKMAREGGAIRKAAGDYATGKSAFLNSGRGQALQKLYPNLPDVIDGVLEGGGHLSVNADYATKWRQSAADAWKSNNYIKAGVVAPMAGVEALTSPLFQKYIPALKLGAMAREISVELKRNGPAIANGEITREAVLQKSVRRVDNILGELNWDNLNMSKGSRSLMQLMYRSPGWRLGTVDLVKNAAYGQLKEAYQGMANRRIPTMDPNLLYLASSVAVGAAVSTVFMSLYAHKAPSSLTDLTNPQTGQVDSRGKPIRLDLPLYTSRDVPEILTNPFGYATGGQSGLISGTVEAFKNRTFSGGMVSEKGGLEGAVTRGAHAVLPKPFVLTGHSRMTQQGFPSSDAWALNAAGMNPSRRDLDMTKSEQILSNTERAVSVTRTGAEQTKQQAIQQIEGAYLNGRYDDMAKVQREKILDKTLTFQEALNATKTAQKPYLLRMAEPLARSGKFDALIQAYKSGTADEKRLLAPLIMHNLSKPGVAEKFKEALNAE